MKNLRHNVSIAVVVICFLVLSFAADANAQAKNSKTKPKPTPEKTKKTTASTSKTSKNTAVKTANTKISSAAKSAKNSDKSKTDAKTKSDKNKKSEKDKKSTAKTNVKPASAKNIVSTKQKVVKEKIAPKPKTANISPPEVKKTPITPAPKPVENQKVIVSKTSGHINREPNTDSPVIQNSQIGTILSVLEKNGDWYKVSFAGSQNASNGWISKKAVTDFNFVRRNEIYQDIADANFSKDTKNFAAAVELFNFLTTAQREIKEENLLADIRFKRLLTLKAALEAIPGDNAKENPYLNFIQANEKEIVYSEPAAAWLVRLEIYWRLHDQYKHLPIGEEIAWQAANSPIAGECEGYINCYLYKVRTTFGEYLNFYPDGKYSREALTDIAGALQPLAEDARKKSVYYAASDTTDRAEFNTFLSEIRMIISKTSNLEKTKVIQQVSQIAEGYR